MKKTLLLTLEFPPHGGGVARYLKNFCLRFLPEELVVVAPQENGAGVFDATLKYRVVRKRLLFQIFRPRWIKMVMQVFVLAQKEPIQKIIISHVLPVGYIALFFQKLWGIPYEVIVHGLDVRIPRASPWKYFWMKCILRNAERIIANSNFTKNEVITAGIAPEKIMVQYPCLHPADYPQANPNAIMQFKKDHKLEDTKTLLTVGRLVERKGQDKVIEAMAILKKTYPDLRYMIVGTGPDEARLRELVKTFGVEKDVIFFGRVPEKIFPMLFSVCDIFCMVSRELPDGDVEGFGMVYLEANWYGKPVVTGQGGGVNEAVVDNETGVIVKNPEDAEAIAETLHTLLQSPEKRIALGVRGQERVRQKFLCK